jgi:hypothetical protein
MGIPCFDTIFSTALRHTIPFVLVYVSTPREVQYLKPFLTSMLCSIEHCRVKSSGVLNKIANLMRLWLIFYEHGVS